MQKGYKGFTKDFICLKGETNEKQYEVGKTYEEPEADLCNKGLHFCEYPLDCFGYYSPNDGRYAEIEAEKVSDKTDNDSKRVAKKITVKAELSIAAIVKASVDFIMSKIVKSKDATGDRSAATNTGYQSAATNTGYQSAATNTGDWSAATNTGDRSAATNTGNWSAATNTGDRSAATVSGKESIAIATGIEGKARASLGSWIALAEWKRDNEGEWHIIAFKSAQIDGETLKADTFYTLKDGEIVEA